MSLTDPVHLSFRGEAFSAALPSLPVNDSQSLPCIAGESRVHACSSPAMADPWLIWVQILGINGFPTPPSVVVQLLSHVRLFATPWTAAHQASLSFTVSQSLLKLMSFESVMPFNHLVLCCPFSSCLQYCTSLGTDGLYPASVQGWDSIFSIPIQLICQKEPGSKCLGSFLAHPLPGTPFVSYDKSSGTLIYFVPVSHHLHACITDRLSLVFCPTPNLSHEYWVKAYGKEWQAYTDPLCVWGVFVFVTI